MSELHAAEKHWITYITSSGGVGPIAQLYQEYCARGERLEDLREILVRHCAAGHTAVPVPELRNIVEPGSAPMLPEQGERPATCPICAPMGDGIHFHEEPQ